MQHYTIFGETFLWMENGSSRRLVLYHQQLQTFSPLVKNCSSREGDALSVPTTRIMTTMMKGDPCVVSS